MIRRVPVSLFAAALSILPSAEAWAAWPHDPWNGNVLIASGPGQQRYPSILADGAGGAFIAWHDSRNGGSNYDIFIQRVSASGVPLWTANGVSVCGAAGDQANTTLVSDGAGGVIVAWHDLRNGTGFWDIYAQRLNGSGVAQWAANGVALCTATHDQVNPLAVTDGAGGAVVVWTDRRVDGYAGGDIYAQRINAAGVPQWAANGVGVSTATGAQVEPDAIPDGVGGATIVWRDGRNAAPFNGMIFGQYVNGGVMYWGTNGLVVGEGNATAMPRIIKDGADGSIVVWHQLQSGSLNILAQRLNASGVQQWNSPTGAVVCNAAGDQDYPCIAPDGQGGAFISWMDRRADVGDIYAQRIGSGGGRLWSLDGVVMSAANGLQIAPVIAYDGAGSAIVTWTDNRSGFPDVYAQAVTASGGWGGNGVAVSTAAVDQLVPKLVANGAGGAILTWFDTRNGTDNDVYVQRIDRFGELGEPQPDIVTVSDVPNDQGGRVQVEWTASYLDAWPDFAIDGYSVWRRVPNPAPQAALEDGARYRRTVSAFGAQAVYWEYMTTLPARGLAGYSWVAPTTSDQLPGSNPYTSFMVMAEKEGGTPYWSSTPDSGYSIDNLAPAPPSPATGTYAGGSTALHWGANTEPDFFEYRIYRGTTANFAPGPGNLVAAQPDTGHVDAAGAPAYYKVSAVDVHGNESGFALIQPSGTLSAGDLDGGVLSLGVPWPNPARGAMRISFVLPRATDVSLVVHDASGRRVRTLEGGRLEAGRFDRAWDLRDASGVRLTSGLYFVRLEADAQVLHRRIAVVL